METESIVRPVQPNPTLNALSDTDPTGVTMIAAEAGSIACPARDGRAIKDAQSRPRLKALLPPTRSKHTPFKKAFFIKLP